VILQRKYNATKETTMVTWDKTKGKNVSGERRDIERLVLGTGETRIRLIGDVLPRYIYWVVTKEGKKAPVECLGFDRQSESFSSLVKDPFKEINPEIYSEKAQFAYICNVIDRKDGKIKLFDLRATIYRQIVDYVNNNDYGNPADPESGYDISIKKEKTGPLPQNVKYSIIPARNNVALTAAEKALELYELDKIYKRPTYEEQKQWLLQNTMYFEGEASDEFKPTEEASDLD
jgi:hypothetical protein